LILLNLRTCDIYSLDFLSFFFLHKRHTLEYNLFEMIFNALKKKLLRIKRNTFINSIWLIERILLKIFMIIEKHEIKFYSFFCIWDSLYICLIMTLNKSVYNLFLLLLFDSIDIQFWEFNQQTNFISIASLIKIIIKYFIKNLSNILTYSSMTKICIITFFFTIIISIQWYLKLEKKKNTEKDFF